MTHDVTQRRTQHKESNPDCPWNRPDFKIDPTDAQGMPCTCDEIVTAPSQDSSKAHENGQ